MSKPSTNSNQTVYRNPQIHSDLMGLFRRFFDKHRSMKKYLRLTILEREILSRITEAMRLTIEINSCKNVLDTSYIYVRTNTLRAHLENIKAFTHLLWDMRRVSEGFYVLVSAEIEGISKQIAGWQKHLLKKDDPVTVGEEEAISESVAATH